MVSQQQENSRTFKDLYCFLRTFQAWNFIFQIQGLSRIFQDRGNPASPPWNSLHSGQTWRWRSSFFLPFHPPCRIYRNISMCQITILILTNSTFGAKQFMITLVTINVKEITGNSNKNNQFHSLVYFHFVKLQSNTFTERTPKISTD